MGSRSVMYDAVAFRRWFVGACGSIGLEVMSQPMDGAEHWERPKRFKHQSAALFETNPWGCIVRYASGRVLEACTDVRYQAGESSLELAEAVGLKEVLSWIKGKQWQNVIYGLNNNR
ncbi:hypothetical protein POM88_016791 [Heracleum sosnowskyi]|uniref:RNase H type-1 domain-containing protein n=1 Tax=Heracleum sosnowskyi TaxID=360622 RepID=A0AAD8IP24_9APIA|nr:hypothetical protein POM88_016791 [Heracleum sosnowskyi]